MAVFVVDCVSFECMATLFPALSNWKNVVSGWVWVCDLVTLCAAVTATLSSTDNPRFVVRFPIGVAMVSLGSFMFLFFSIEFYVSLNWRKAFFAK